MQCDNCGNEEAVIQLTKMKDNEMKVLHLCEACAAEEGLEAGAAAAGSAPLVDFLKQIGQGIGEETAAAGRCPSCGMAPSQLKQVGRLGCAVCYSHYEPHLRSLLRRLHGGTQHVGKTAPLPDSTEVDRKTRVQSLRRSLQRAVEAEDFEHAATLRDQIRRAEAAE
jgi:protein arginine kinase activator